MKLPNPKNTLRLLYELQQSENKYQEVGSQTLSQELIMFRTWQTNRLAETYSHLLEDPHYTLACQFFLDDIYGAKDFSQRDHDIEKVYQMMLKFLPARVLRPVKVAIELNNLSHNLDEQLLNVLINQLGVTDTITTQLYIEAYRICDNYKERCKQIEMTKVVGKEIGRLAHLPFTSTTLRLARVPAHKAGWYELQSFLERGYEAFKQMKDYKKFIKIVTDCEQEILDRIFDGEENPFDVDCGT